MIVDYSHAFAGYYLGFEPPSTLRTSLALRKATWRNLLCISVPVDGDDERGLMESQPLLQHRVLNSVTVANARRN